MNPPDNLLQPQPLTSETGDVSQVNMQSFPVISSDCNEKKEANSHDDDGNGEEIKNSHDGSGGGGGNSGDKGDNYVRELKTEGNLETEKKDLSYQTSELEIDSSREDKLENEASELPRKQCDEESIYRNGNIVHDASDGNSMSDNDNPDKETTTVTIEKIFYEKLIAEQQRLTDELKRLKERLITVEDDYTNEILELEDRESKVRNELNQALETITQLKTCIKEADQQSDWSERMEQLKVERDAALDDVSKLDDKVHRLTASVTNLQLVIEQIQKENEKKVTSLTKQHLAALESERAIQNDLRQEVEMVKKKSMESVHALEAATRLTENIDKKEEIIQNLKQELCDKERQISDLEMDKDNLKASFEGKVDKQVIKNLILGYFGTPNDKKHEVERLLARVLDFNEQEMIRAGLSFGRPSNKFGLDAFTSSGLSSTVTNPTSNSTATAGSILLAPLQSTHDNYPSSVGSLPSSSTSLYSNDQAASGTSGSLSKMFVEFLEAESRPKPGTVNVHPSSSFARELARDLTKVANTPNSKTHLFLEPNLPVGPSKLIPVPVPVPVPSNHPVAGSQSSSFAPVNHISQLNSHPSTVDHLSTGPPTSINKTLFSGNLYSSYSSNPIHPVKIASNDNTLTESESSSSSIIPVGSISTATTTPPSLSSSSSLILSNLMPSYTNAIKPITFDANSHTQQPSQPPQLQSQLLQPQSSSLSSSSSSSLTAIYPAIVTSSSSLPPQQMIAQSQQQQQQQPSTSLSSHYLLSLTEKPSHFNTSLSSSSSSLLTVSTQSTSSQQQQPHLLQM